MVFHSVEEDVEQADQVCGSGHVLRVELNTGKKESQGFNHIFYSQTDQLTFLVCVITSASVSYLNRGCVLCTMPSLL